MLSRTLTIAFEGVNTKLVDVQVHVTSGLPSFTIVGMADKSVSESRDRLRSAFSSSGFAIPPKKITVNLSPSDLLKEGSYFDLPIALALLAALEIIPMEELINFIALGELALNGDIKNINGVLAASLFALKQQKGIIFPKSQVGEVFFLNNKLDLLPIINLKEIVNHFNNKKIIKITLPEKTESKDFLEKYYDISEIKGQENAKRALTIAAAGSHNLLMIGAPGTGKSMLANALRGILPPLSPEESVDVSLIYSIAGELKNNNLILDRPIRSPHHSSSVAALIGGGKKIKPGEITLAHKGILFLDEFAEFPSNVLDALREPLETSTISISRVNSKVTFPADFQLIAAMNPCKCGYFGYGERECTKAPYCAEDYQRKISGPLLDRIDLTIEIPPLDLYHLTSNKKQENSKEVQKKVVNARKIQLERYKNLNFNTNSKASGKVLEEIMNLEKDAQELLMNFATKYKLSARGYYRIIKVARTIADLENSYNIIKTHIAEAINYRKINYIKK